MLANLMKYELKATSRFLLPLYIILLCLSLGNRFILNINNDFIGLKIIQGFFIMAYIISILTVLAVTLFYMIIRFYKNLFTDEGYLMFTLPAKAHKHITSKLIITILWTIISVAVVLMSLYFVFSISSIFPEIINEVKESVAKLNEQFGARWITIPTELSIIFALGLLASILQIYVSIAIGQLFSKHKIIASFGAYIAIYTGIQFIGVIFILIFGAFMVNKTFEVSLLYQIIFPGSIIILMIECVVFYLATNYIFKRKLNLD